MLQISAWRLRTYSTCPFVFVDSANCATSTIICQLHCLVVPDCKRTRDTRDKEIKKKKHEVRSDYINIRRSVPFNQKYVVTIFCIGILSNFINNAKTYDVRLIKFHTNTAAHEIYIVYYIIFFHCFSPYFISSYHFLSKLWHVSAMNSSFRGLFRNSILYRGTLLNSHVFLVLQFPPRASSDQ